MTIPREPRRVMNVECSRRESVPGPEDRLRGGHGDRAAAVGAVELAVWDLNAKLNDFMIVADSAVCVDGYARAAAESGKKLKILVDVDIGLHRTGILPGEPALGLAKRIAASPHLQFAGLQGYAGQLQHTPVFEERRELSLAALKSLGETRDAQSLVEINKTEERLVQIPLLPVRFVPLVHGRAGVAARQPRSTRGEG